MLRFASAAWAAAKASTTTATASRRTRAPRSRSWSGASRTPLVLGGFSFGSVVALRVAAQDARVRTVFALGFPLVRFGDASVLRAVAAAPYLRTWAAGRVRRRRDAARPRRAAAAASRARRRPGGRAASSTDSSTPCRRASQRRGAREAMGTGGGQVLNRALPDRGTIQRDLTPITSISHAALLHRLLRSQREAQIDGVALQHPLGGVLSPTAGPCLKPWPEPPPHGHTFS